MPQLQRPVFREPAAWQHLLSLTELNDLIGD